MAIIKNGRINIWNAVKKQFETVHPETETARITDFADGIVQKLALTSAMTAVTALQTDSWFGKLLKMALTASGVRYNIAQNGYVCFGSFFGGLIVQWGYYGKASSAGNDANIIYPVSFTKFVIPAYCLNADVNSDLDSQTQGGVTKVTLTGMRLWSWQDQSDGFFWIAIGI